MRFGPCLAILLSCLGGCSGPDYGVRLTAADTAEAIGYAGHAVGAGEERLTIDVDREVRFGYAGKRLATIGIPKGWKWRVQSSMAREEDGRRYDWGSAQFETPQGKVEINLRYFGDEAIFLKVNGRRERIAAGAAFDVAEGRNGYELVRRGA